MNSPTTPQPLKGEFHTIAAASDGEHVDLVMRFPRGKAPSIYTLYQLIPLDASHQSAARIIERMADSFLDTSGCAHPQCRKCATLKARAAFRALTEEGK